MRNGCLPPSSEAHLSYSRGGRTLISSFSPLHRTTPSLQILAPRSAQTFNAVMSSLLMPSSSRPSFRRPLPPTTPSLGYPPLSLNLTRLFNEHLIGPSHGTYMAPPMVPTWPLPWYLYGPSHGTYMATPMAPPIVPRWPLPLNLPKLRHFDQ